MTSKAKFEVKKAVFQVKYKPNLDYYNQMYCHTELFSEYPHWETDRLRLTLKDYIGKQNIVIKHDSVGYETDLYKRKKVEKASQVIDSYFSAVKSIDSVTRIGYRTWALSPVSMDFEELKDILELKLITPSFIQEVSSTTDLSLTINGIKNELEYRLMIGPMKKSEIPNFIRYNIDSHIDQNSLSKYDEVVEVLKSYPEVSLYMDLDIYKNFKEQDQLQVSEIESFFKDSQDLVDQISEKLIEFVFAVKI